MNANDYKNKLMVTIKNMPPDEAKDALLTLAWKVDPKIVHRVLCERGVISDPLAWALEAVKS